MSAWSGRSMMSLISVRTFCTLPCVALSRRMRSLLSMRRAHSSHSLRVWQHVQEEKSTHVSARIVYETRTLLRACVCGNMWAGHEQIHTSKHTGRNTGSKNLSDNTAAHIHMTHAQAPMCTRTHVIQTRITHLKIVSKDALSLSTCL